MNQPYVCILVFSVFAITMTSPSRGDDSPASKDTLKTLAEQIQIGRWVEARDSAKSQLKGQNFVVAIGPEDAAKVAVAAYVIDVANDFLNEPGKQQQFSL